MSRQPIKSFRSASEVEPLSRRDVLDGSAPLGMYLVTEFLPHAHDEQTLLALCYLAHTRLPSSSDADTDRGSLATVLIFP